jgi:type III pantothenate kinase
MLLLIDAGNTRVKWALAESASCTASVPGRWIASSAVAHDDIGRLDTAWQSHAVDRVIISNVAGPQVEALLCAQLQRIATRIPAPAVTWFASTAAVAGVRNGYREPHRLGCDRLAALVGARALLPERALIVATCGTATTVDALDASGLFIGGMILPGPGTMAASLAQRTAQLPSLPEHRAAERLTLFADNTEAAIRNGCLAAQAGAIDRAIAAHGGAHCLLSGGGAAWVGPYLEAGFTLADNLVLTGLHAVALAQPAVSEIIDRNGVAPSAGPRPC